MLFKEEPITYLYQLLSKSFKLGYIWNQFYQALITLKFYVNRVKCCKENTQITLASTTQTTAKKQLMWKTTSIILLFHVWNSKNHSFNKALLNTLGILETILDMDMN